MINRKATIVAVIAAVVGLGGGITALSWGDDRQVREGVSLGDDRDHGHDHAKENNGQAVPHRPCCEQAGHGDQHEEHGSEDAPGDDDHEDHDGHDDHAGRGEHGEESFVRLGNEERNKFGVKVATAGSGTLTTHIRLPAEIVLNADRVAHIVPRAPGVVRDVVKNVGDTVRAGEVMAWLESAELGEAKVDYLAKWAEVGCCTLDLTRAQEVNDNTMRLLETLKSSPSLDTLRELNGGAMGENRSILVSAYAESVFAESAYLREKPLFEKKIASERDFQAAEAEYKKADAMYAATRDSVDFKVRRALLEAKRGRQVSEIELKGARRRLFVLGLRSAEITELEALANAQTDAVNQAPACDDPNCTGCKAHGQSGTAVQDAEEKLAWYPLRAPFSGTVIDKHLTLGEKHSDESGAFTVADLSSVWVDVAVYQKDLAYVKEGMNITISAGPEMPDAQGTISYVAPVVDEVTRTALARVVLPNTNADWRPGLFVNAEIAIGGEGASVVIPKSAIQRIDKGPVVFLDTDDGFEPVPVVLGRSNATRVEVLSGLFVGQRYVAQGAFELKAMIVTSGLGAHAGHGH